jgi:hypothetical protein
MQELWALIMDAGTTYTAQTYNLTSQFLPKEWIMEKWEEGFYITAMAGSNSGWSLVAMSKGTAYTQQSYKVLPVWQLVQYSSFLGCVFLMGHPTSMSIRDLE